MDDIEKAKFLLSHKKVISYFGHDKIDFTCWLNFDGNYDGPWNQWHQSGGKKYEATYKDGQLEGELKSYWENGMLEMHKLYKNGIIIHDYRS